MILYLFIRKQIYGNLRRFILFIYFYLLLGFLFCLASISLASSLVSGIQYLWDRTARSGIIYIVRKGKAVLYNGSRYVCVSIYVNSNVCY